MYLASLIIFCYEKNGKDHDDTLQRVLQVCRQVNLTLNTDKCHFRCMQVLFFCKIISQKWCETGSMKTQSNDGDTSSKTTPSIPWNDK